MDVYLEAGDKRVFAASVDWPGWCRSGRDPDSALQALLDYGPRYARVVQNGNFNFSPPGTKNEFNVIQTLEGSATTDFGAPDSAPALDAQPVDAAELDRLQVLLQACWQTFDEIVHSAA